MCDIVHVPGKTGADLLKVCDKQWAVFNLNRFGCCNGVGDGGGENEGFHGIHHLLEHSQNDYVRRRCFGHLPWRVADACLDAMGEDHAKLHSICNYVRDSTTW